VVPGTREEGGEGDGNKWEKGEREESGESVWCRCNSCGGEMSSIKG